MKKKYAILIFAGLALLAVAVWACLRAGNAVVVTGNITPEEIAHAKSLVRKDMAKRVFPGFSWANVRSLPANVRAYFRYQIIEINARPSPLVETDVRVGDGATVAASKHVCDYVLHKGPKGWFIGMIFTGNTRPTPTLSPIPVRFPPTNSPVPFRIPPTNLPGPMPMRPVRMEPNYAGLPVNTPRPLPTNITVPHMTMWAPPPPGVVLPPLPSTNLSSPVAASNRLALPPPPPAYFGSAIPLYPGTNTHFVSVSYGGLTSRGRVLSPRSNASLTNLMPVGP